MVKSLNKIAEVSQNVNIRCLVSFFSSTRVLWKNFGNWHYQWNTV